MQYLALVEEQVTPIAYTCRSYLANRQRTTRYIY
jgi:hypothetical protein